MVAAISSSVTTPAALFAGLGGMLLLFLGPVWASHITHAGSPGEATMPRSARWLVLGGCEGMAALLLFTAGKALDIIPNLTTPVKLGVILLAALCLRGPFLLVPSVRRSCV